MPGPVGLAELAGRLSDHLEDEVADRRRGTSRPDQAQPGDAAVLPRHVEQCLRHVALDVGQAPEQPVPARARAGGAGPSPPRPEDALPVVRDGRAQGVQVDTGNLGQRPDGERDEVGAVGAAPMWHGREVRRVRLDEDGVERRAAAASRSAPALENVTVPAKLSMKPRLAHSAANAASPEKQCMTTRSGAPSSSSTLSTSAWASRSWMTRALPNRFAMAMWARKLASCGARPSGAGAVVVEAGLPHGADPRSGERLDLAQRLIQPFWCRTVIAGAPRSGARRPWRPPRRAPRRASTPHRDDGTSTPTWTSRSTPTAVGRRDLLGRVATDDVEMGVAVEHGDGQRLRRGRALSGIRARISQARPAARSLARYRVTRSDFPCASTDKSTGSRYDTVGTPAMRRGSFRVRPRASRIPRPTRSSRWRDLAYSSTSPSAR